MIDLIVNAYNKVMYDVTDPRITAYPLMSSPLPVLILLSCWYMFIKKFGVDYMRNRPAMEIKPIIQAYNISQVIINSLITITVIKVVYKRENLTCIISQGYSDDDLFEVFFSLIFLFSRFLDLFDTVFFVLRKKFNLITTLHVYHHLLTSGMSWYLVRIVPGGEAIAYGFLNSIVHAVMYSYYFYALQRPRKQDVWFKKYITQLQLVQFVLLAIYYTAKLFMTCAYPKIIILFMLTQCFVMLKMFGSYYYKTFIAPKAPKKDK